MKGGGARISPARETVRALRKDCARDGRPSPSLVALAKMVSISYESVSV